MKELEQQLADWHFRRFGAVIDPLRTALKLSEESGEVAKAVLRGDRENLEEEIADCTAVLIHLARYCGKPLVDLVAAKLPVLEERLKKKLAGKR